MSEKSSASPVVSVVMPVLNGARYLDAAVASVLAQTFQDFEFVIVDDGSTDASPRILAAHAERDPRLRILTQYHDGVVAALNRGLAAAQGRYLARLDADDLALPKRFARQVAALDADPTLGALGTFVECIDEADRPIRTFEGPLDHETLDAGHIAGEGPRLWHPSVMMRTEVLRRAGGYSSDYPYTEDYALWLRMAEVSRLATLPEPLTRYRLHFKSVSVTRRDTQIDSARRAVADARLRRGLPPLAAARMNEQVQSELDIVRKWGWWALKAGNRKTARHYALVSLLRAPVSRASVHLCVQSFLPRT